MSGKFLGQNGPTFDTGPDSARRSFPGGKRFAYVSEDALEIEEERHNGSVLFIHGTGAKALTLPKMPKIGFTVELLVWEAVSGGNLTVTSADADELYFGALESVVAAGTQSVFLPDGSDDRILTWNGSTFGGLKGSHVWFTYVAPRSGIGQWLVEGRAVASGSVATPFS